MTQIILTEQLRAQLPGLTGPVEFVDPSGKYLGMFLPTAEAHKRDVLNAWIKTLVSAEELQAAREEIRREGGLTTDEVRANMKRLEERARCG